MQNRLRLISLFLLPGLIILFGCGGSQETVRPDLNTANDLPVEEPVKEDSPADRTNPEPEAPKPDIEPPKPVNFKTVHFEYDKSDLTPEARTILAENARLLQENPKVYIRVEGHCDERGTVEYNLALGERRAIATRNYLINYGVSPGRITVISYGKERPVDAGHSAQAWAANRRAEFVKLSE